MRVRSVSACIAWLMVCASACARPLPPGFVDLQISDGWNQVCGLTFGKAGTPYSDRLFVWEKSGLVWLVENGVRLSTPLLDIREEVGDWNDFGLLGFATDPDYHINGYIYVYYVVDYYHLKFFGTPQYDPTATWTNIDTISRVTRYTANAADGFRTVDPASRHILIGEGMGSGPPVLHLSHGACALAFGTDGTLMVSTGDGASFQNLDIGGPRPSSSNTGLPDGIITTKEDVGCFRSQLIDSLNGKILRIDPATGDGIPSNPYYDSTRPRSAQSRVWALGLRNPCRMVLRPGTGVTDPAAGNPGVFYLGDVGLDNFEELNVCTGPTQNFGWPVFEGLEPCTNFGFGYPNANVQNKDAPNNLLGQGCGNRAFFYFRELIIQDTLAPTFPHPCNANQQLPSNVPHWVHKRPSIEWSHDSLPARVGSYSGNNAVAVAIGDPGSPVQGAQFFGNASIGGVWYTGASFPPEYHNTYFHGDFGHAWIRNFVFDSNNNPTAARDFLPDEAARVTAITMHPDTGDLYYISFMADQFDRAKLRRIVYFGGANQPPAALASIVGNNYGPTPVTMQFDGSASYDPENHALSYEWDFGDGSPRSRVAQPSHIYTQDRDITDLGTIISRVEQLSPPYPFGSGNKDPETIRDSDMPPVGNPDPLRQYDTFHEGQQGGDDWIGYTFTSTQTFTGLIFQEGIHFDRGGWWNNYHVEVKQGSNWITVPGLTTTPPYAGNNGIDYETYVLRFPAISGTGIRIRGAGGGDREFFSVAELRVLSTFPEGSGPRCHTVTLKVTDELGSSSTTTLKVSPNNTPPTVVLTSPLPGTQFPTTHRITVPLTADVSDAESPNNQLECVWLTVLHHNNHTHPEPPVLNCTSSASVAKHVEDPSQCDEFYYEFQLVVTDPHCLTTAITVDMFPNCCFADVNNDGFADGLDYDMFVNAFLNADLLADFNDDTFVDAIDYDEFITFWLQGC